jgi:hypothetical protein
MIRAAPRRRDAFRLNRTRSNAALNAEIGNRGWTRNQRADASQDHRAENSASSTPTRDMNRLAQVRRDRRR